jgi:signal transduction histidine kinase
VQEHEIVPAPIALDANLLLNEVAQDCAIQARRRRLMLRTEFAPLPVCRLDPRHFERIIKNILAFAIGRTPSGEVVLRTAVRNEWMVFEVTDYGSTPSQAELRALLERPALDGRTGPGLGLYIARWMAEAIGGRLEARYSRGKGITLVAELPLQAPERDPRGR